MNARAKKITREVGLFHGSRTITKWVVDLGGTDSYLEFATEEEASNKAEEVNAILRSTGQSASEWYKSHGF